MRKTVFTPGNKYNDLRKTRSGGGRKPSPVKVEIDAIRRDKRNVPKYLKRISSIALNAADEKLALQAAMYLIDRHEGKAKQTSEIAITPRAYSPDEYELMAQVKIAQDRLLLDADASPYIVDHTGDEGINGTGHDYDTNERESGAASLLSDYFTTPEPNLT